MANEDRGSQAEVPDPRVGPLHQLKVVDLTTDLGVLAAKMLAGFGAKLIRVEPIGGDPLRQKSPMIMGNDGKEISLYWAHMVGGRECRRLALESESDRKQLVHLLGQADIIVESQPPGTFESVGLGYEAVRQTSPRLIWTSITPFGRGGPHSDWVGTDLIGMASGGLMSLSGDPDRAPLRPTVEQGYAQAGTAAVVGTLAAVQARRMTGLGQLVDVSMQEAVSNCLGNARLYYEFEGMVSRRAGGGRAHGEFGSRLVFPCLDGFVAFTRTASMVPLHKWMKDLGFEPGFDPVEWAALPQSGSGAPGPDKIHEFEESIAEFFHDRPKVGLYEEGQKRGILIAPVSTPADLLQNSQLIERQYFSEERVAGLPDPIRLPGPPVQFSKTPWTRESNRPAWGETTDGDRPGTRNPETKDGRQILSGLRVADFSWVGVGPIATQVLAALGAQVIRVESSTRLETLRSSGPKRGSDADASAYFANFNRDKLGITLNLKQPAARDVALRLISRCDVFVESFRPGFIESIGLAYPDVCRSNPRLIMMSCSMAGATGPHRGFGGFGLTIQAASGFTHFTGWPDRPPVGLGTAYTDWLSTNIASSSLLAAIEHRKRTEEGQYIDLSQIEASIWGLDAEIIRYTTTGAVGTAMGNRHIDMSPHGVFPCRGQDQWVALAIRHNADWHALSKLVDVLHQPHWESLNLEGRKDSDLEIERLISDWTRQYDKFWIADKLQDRGIPGHAVNDVGDVHRDIQLRSRGHFWSIKHPVIGNADWDGPAFRLSETPLRPADAAPLLGQHNSYVYKDILGYTDDQLAEMTAVGLLD